MTFQDLRGKLLTILPVALPFLWLLGVRSKHLYLVLTVLVLLAGLSGKMRKVSIASSPRPFILFIFIYLTLLPISQLAKCLVGQQGVDFALLAQAFENRFWTTLLSHEPVHFLTHHFAPLLAIAFPFTEVGIPGWVTAVLLHSFSCAASVYLFFLVGRELRLPLLHTAVACTLLLLHPNLRVALFWETHDEILALPLLTLAVLLHLRGRFSKASLTLCLAMLCKETFFFLPPAFVLITLIEERKITKNLLPYLFTSLIGAIGIYLYILSPPSILHRSFDSMSRLGSTADLLVWRDLVGKFEFLGVLILPMLSLPLLTKEGRKLSLVAAPFIGMILISRGQVMYHLYNYYSVLPTFLLGLAALSTIAQYRQLRSLPIALSLSISLSLGAFSHPKHAPLILAKSGALSTPPETILPLGAAVAAPDYDALFFIRNYKPVRWGLAESGAAQWSYAVVRTGEVLPPSMAAISDKVYEDREWKVYLRTTAPPSRHSGRSRSNRAERPSQRARVEREDEER